MKFFVPVGRTVETLTQPERAFGIMFEQYMNLAIISMPRYGKGGLAKPLVVRVAHQRRVCVFDFKGEWVSHVTRPNYRSDVADFIADYKAYRGFTFHLRDFKLTQDWVSMGFGNGAEQLKNLFCDTWAHHQGIPSKFLEVVMDLPTREAQIGEFNSKYGPVLRGAFNWMFVQDYKNNLPHRLKWFWQGPGDTRPIYDFNKEWFEHWVIFIDFSVGDDGDIDSRYKHQTFFGKILEKMQPVFVHIKGVLVIEEADVLLPNPRGHGRPSSNHQMIHFSAKAPKTGMACILIMQNRDQTDPLIFRGGQWSWFLGLYENYPKPFRGLPNIRGDEREFIYLDTYRRWTKFKPGVPCCEFESNIKGGEA